MLDCAPGQIGFERLLTSLVYSILISLELLETRMLENQGAQLLLQEKQLSLKQDCISLQAEDVKLLRGLVDNFSTVIVSSEFQVSATTYPGASPLSSQPKTNPGVSLSPPMHHPAFLKRKNSTHGEVWDIIRKNIRNANISDDESESL
jgi:hypothetical protein